MYEELDRRAEELASRIRGYDPVAVSPRLERMVQRGTARKYFRFRVSRFYGGSVVGDVVLCNLRCAFCWTGRARDDPRLGEFYEAEVAARRLLDLAGRHGIRVIRLSAGEPTLGRRHLASLLEELSIGMRGRVFVLETNGLLLAVDDWLLREISRWEFVHARVSIKACSPAWFKLLTGAVGDALWLQVKAVRRLLDHGVSTHVAVFAAFGSDRCWAQLLEQLASTAGPEVLETLEVEALVEYPTAKRRLRFLEKLGIKPRPELVYPPPR